MLPPVLEIYVLWHPRDTAGGTVAAELDRHFHGDPFTGMIGGAVEVYSRSTGWLRQDGPPRPIPFPDDPPPNQVTQAVLTVVVPIFGSNLDEAVDDTGGAWWAYLKRVADARKATPQRVAIFPYQVNDDADQGELIRLFGHLQYIGRDGVPGDEDQAWRRDLVQGIVQFAGEEAQQRLTVFISHTHAAPIGHDHNARNFTERVRTVIGQTRLRDFFSARDLPPGVDYPQVLLAEAARSALLGLRTDHYASRPWCQTEVLTAKRAGMPVVMLDALIQGDRRGSFLMDHTPRVPAVGTDTSIDAGIRAGLNLLVDQCLQRVLWQHQRRLAEVHAAGLGVSWWASHAPEPATLAAWVADERAHGGLPEGATVRILHPDPPLGEAEHEVLKQMAAWGGITDGGLDILTPRQVAARGG